MTNYRDELCHHGIKGQKWGVRRFQNKDGSLTAAGRKRNGKQKQSSASSTEAKNHGLSKGQKTAIAVGATVVAAGLAAYGTYKLHELNVKSDVTAEVTKAYNALADTKADEIIYSHPMSECDQDFLRKSLREGYKTEIKRDVGRIYKDEAAQQRKNLVENVRNKIEWRGKDWKPGYAQRKGTAGPKSATRIKWENGMDMRQLTSNYNKEAAETSFAKKYGWDAADNLIKKKRG